MHLIATRAHSRSRLFFAGAAIAAVAPEDPRSVVVLIGDGMGVAQRAAIQYFH